MTGSFLDAGILMRIVSYLSVLTGSK
jgi:hypothetical protein